MELISTLEIYLPSHIPHSVTNMIFENHSFTNSAASIMNMPPEPRGSYLGSNEFIRKLTNFYFRIISNAFMDV